MHEQTIHLHHKAPAKPPEGTPCNGCGICCALETCPAARLRFMRFTGPCPALQWSEAGSRYHCGMLTTPEKYLGWIGAAGRILIKRAISRWIAAGKGCDCSADVQP